MFPKVIALSPARTEPQAQAHRHDLMPGKAEIAAWTALELTDFVTRQRNGAFTCWCRRHGKVVASPKVKIIRTTRLDPNAWPNGLLRVCSPARAVVDALRGNDNQRLIRAIVAEAVQKAIARGAAIIEELEAAPNETSVPGK